MSSLTIAGAVVAAVAVGLVLYWVLLRRGAKRILAQARRQAAKTLEGLRAHHSIAYSRQTLGFEFSETEQEALKGAIHPLVRTIPRSKRRSLYLASHASRIVDWPVPEGRLLLRDLIEHATQPEFVYRHRWRVGDLVIWDNRATMHRARPFDDVRYRRELRRVTTLDVEREAPVTSGA